MKKKGKKSLKKRQGSVLDIQRFVSGILCLIWLAVLISIITLKPENFSAFLFSFISFLFLGIAAITKGSRFTSMFGKILMFFGIIALISLLVKNGLDIANLDGAIRTAALVSGIYLEKISPYKQLKKFMLLAIATKVQFILVASFISLARSNQAVEGLIPLGAWWFVVVAMGLSVPLVAFHLRPLYKISVWFTTVLALALFIDFALSNSGPYMLVLVAITVFLWPVVTERLVGRKVFLGGKK